jgi:vacuolar-type H+-ATPase subunit H
MSRESVLRAIKNAEKTASETILNAKKEAASIISQARINASEIIDSELSKSESDNQNLINEARDNANSEAKLVTDDGDTAQQILHDSGKKNRARAKKIVIDAFKK